MVAISPEEAMIRFEEIGVVVGLAVEVTQRICDEVGLTIVSDETPNQQIIGGKHTDLFAACELALEAGALEARSLDTYRNRFTF